LLSTPQITPAAEIGKLARRRLLGRAAYLKSQGGPH
jgi:hypothetical protein